MNDENKQLLQDVIDQLLYNPEFKERLKSFMKSFNKISKLSTSKLYRTYEKPIIGKQANS